jgi:8-oxo-dGTP pyrophosphatase MutT (NUDIX family)
VTDISFEECARMIRERLGGHHPQRLEVQGFRRAAVLVPILHRPEGPTLLFTRRTETMTHHAGQIAFPGGRCEEGEEPGEAALREALEEVGLQPGGVEIAAMLDDCASVSSYVVTPVVGLVATPPPLFSHQEDEVLEPFEVPLRTLLDTSCLRYEWWDRSHIPPGAPADVLLQLRAQSQDFDAEMSRYKIYFFHADPEPQRVIWGLTARILKDLLDRVFCFSG